MTYKGAIKEMKIIFVTQHLTDGGAERGMIAFANALACLGEDVCIAYMEDIGTDYPINPKVQTFLMHHNSKVSIPKLRGLCNILLPIKQLRQLSGDVFILDNLSLKYNWKVLGAASFSRRKVVYAIVNNMGKKQFDKKRKKQYEKTCRRADAIWIQTEGQRDFLPKYLQKKIFKVRNILDRQFLSTQKKYNNEVCHFVSAGRLHPQKNQKLLIEAFVRLLDRTGNDTATLTIYGKSKIHNDQTEAQLREMIQKYHLEKRVFLPGWEKDMEVKFAQADAFLFGSDYEGLPYALMEAMASGLPCISTDCPTGPSDLITSGENGILVPVGNVDAMSQAMELLIKQPQWAENLGKRARQTMLEWGDPEELAKHLLVQLRRICK